jgi:hypothetical protein
MSDRGVVLSLALDAVDPRLDPGVRAESLVCAVGADPALSASVWTGLLVSMLTAHGARNGPGALDAMMTGLAGVMVGVMDPVPDV